MLILPLPLILTLTYIRAHTSFTLTLIHTAAFSDLPRFRFRIHTAVLVYVSRKYHIRLRGEIDNYAYGKRVGVQKFTRKYEYR